MFCRSARDGGWTAMGCLISFMTERAARHDNPLEGPQSITVVSMRQRTWTCSAEPAGGCAGPVDLSGGTEEVPLICPGDTPLPGSET